MDGVLRNVGDARPVGRNRGLRAVSAVTFVLFENRRDGARLKVDSRESHALGARIRAHDQRKPAPDGREKALLPGSDDFELVCLRRCKRCSPRPVRRRTPEDTLADEENVLPRFVPGRRIHLEGQLLGPRVLGDPTRRSAGRRDHVDLVLHRGSAGSPGNAIAGGRPTEGIREKRQAQIRCDDPRLTTGKVLHDEVVKVLTRSGFLRSSE